jgi:hypothetical protein
MVKAGPNFPLMPTITTPRLADETLSFSDGIEAGSTAGAAAKKSTNRPISRVLYRAEARRRSFL